MSVPRWGLTWTLMMATFSAVVGGSVQFGWATGVMNNAQIPVNASFYEHNHPIPSFGWDCKPLDMLQQSTPCGFLFCRSLSFAALFSLLSLPLSLSLCLRSLRVHIQRRWSCWRHPGRCACQPTGQTERPSGEQLDDSAGHRSVHLRPHVGYARSWTLLHWRRRRYHSNIQDLTHTFAAK